MILFEVNILKWLLEFLKGYCKTTVKGGGILKQKTDQKVYQFTMVAKKIINI